MLNALLGVGVPVGILDGLVVMVGCAVEGAGVLLTPLVGVTCVPVGVLVVEMAMLGIFVGVAILVGQGAFDGTGALLGTGVSVGVGIVVFPNSFSIKPISCWNSPRNSLSKLVSLLPPPLLLFLCLWCLCTVCVAVTD